MRWWRDWFLWLGVMVGDFSSAGISLFGLLMGVHM